MRMVETASTASSKSITRPTSHTASNRSVPSVAGALTRDGQRYQAVGRPQSSTSFCERARRDTGQH
jgi:hypothetical protein